MQEGLQESMGEELTAANWYRQRMRYAFSQRDEPTAKLYEHIVDEEDKHYKEFSEQLHTLRVRQEMLQEATERK